MTFDGIAMNQGQTWAERLAAYVREHNLPAYVTPDGRIATIDRYIDRNGILHEDAITLPVSISYIREWLGY